jgi:hypothetical protein
VVLNMKDDYFSFAKLIFLGSAELVLIMVCIHYLVKYLLIKFNIFRKTGETSKTGKTSQSRILDSFSTKLPLDVIDQLEVLDLDQNGN